MLQEANSFCCSGLGACSVLPGEISRESGGHGREQDLTRPNAMAGSSPDQKVGQYLPCSENSLFPISALPLDFFPMFDAPSHNSLNTTCRYRLCSSAKYNSRGRRISPAKKHLYTHLQHFANLWQKDKCSVYIWSPAHSSGSEQGITPTQL